MEFIIILLNSILSHWPGIAFLIITALVVKSLRKKKHDPLAGLPEIKPHWLWGNMDFSKNFNMPSFEHYQKTKGLRYCTFYQLNEKRLFVLDPDICSKIMITDFDHFEYVPFLPMEYCDVRLLIICFFIRFNRSNSLYT